MGSRHKQNNVHHISRLIPVRSAETVPRPVPLRSLSLLVAWRGGVNFCLLLREAIYASACTTSKAVHRWLWWPNDTRGRIRSKFPDFCPTVEEKSRKNFNQKIDTIGDRTRARCMRGNDVTPRPQRWSRPILAPYSNARVVKVKIDREYSQPRTWLYFSANYCNYCIAKWCGWR